MKWLLSGQCCLGVLLGTFAGTIGNGRAAQAQERAPAAAVQPATAGQRLYVRHCAACHGDSGDGKGIAADFLYPKPRNFRSARYKLVSTSNAVPTPDDLHAVLVRGMPGSSMPSWAHLPEEERRLLVEEIVRLTKLGARERYIANLKEQEQLTDEEIAEPDVQAEIEDFARRQTTPGELTEVPAIQAADAAAIARGKDLYTRQSCHSCHGNEGKGDGVQKMIDDDGFPTRARDLTQGIYKGGHDPASLFRRIRYGMPGTPMPASINFAESEAIDLVHFLRSLSTEEQREAAVLKREKIVVRRVTELPANSDATSWQSAPVSVVRLAPLWWRDDAVPAIQVQAVHDGRSVAFRLVWEDATPDRHSGKSEAFKDAVALELVRGPDEPFLGMGATTTPIDLWMWDADRGQSAGELEEVNPRVVVDVYPLTETLPQSAEFSRPGTKTSAQADVVLPAKAVGNPIVRSGPPTGASSLAAAGPGSVTFRPVKSQLVGASGGWSQGKWTVLMRRSLHVAAPEDGIVLAPGQTASVAFAVWDGSHRDRNGQKQVSIWQDLILDGPR